MKKHSEIETAAIALCARPNKIGQDVLLLLPYRFGGEKLQALHHDQPLPNIARHDNYALLGQHQLDMELIEIKTRFSWKEAL
jgi:hypothetical protein